jgi:hypothetical protein
VSDNLDFDVAELVHKCYQRVVERHGIIKGAGISAIDYHEVVAEVVAEVGVMWDRQLRKNRKMLKRNAESIAKLAAAHGAVPSVPVIEKGYRDLNMTEDVVGFVRKQQVPKVNGSHRGDGVASAAPPVWHPEAGE